MNPSEYIPLNWGEAPAGPEKDMRFEFANNVWQAQSTSCPEVLHRLHLLRDGRGFCTCEDFKYRTTKTGKPCKHLRTLNFQKHIKEGF